MSSSIHLPAPTIFSNDVYSTVIDFFILDLVFGYLCKSIAGLEKQSSIKLKDFNCLILCTNNSAGVRTIKSQSGNEVSKLQKRELLIVAVSCYRYCFYHPVAASRFYRSLMGTINQ